MLLRDFYVPAMAELSILSTHTGICSDSNRDIALGRSDVMIILAPKINGDRIRHLGRDNPS
jgi:hypothetical protein